MGGIEGYDCVIFVMACILCVVVCIVSVPPETLHVVTIELRCHVAVLKRVGKDIKKFRTKDEYILGSTCAFFTSATSSFLGSIILTFTYLFNAA
jgi:hypothetical protein